LIITIPRINKTIKKTNIIPSNAMGTSLPKKLALNALLAWVKGKKERGTLIKVGIFSNGKNVPQKNVIGIIKKFENVAVSSWDLARQPEITPKDAKTKQFSTQAIRNTGFLGNPVPNIAPAIRIKLEANIPLTTPAKTSPSIISIGVMGLTINSSKVLKCSLPTDIEVAIHEYELVIELIAQMPGTTNARYAMPSTLIPLPSPRPKATRYNNGVITFENRYPILKSRLLNIIISFRNTG
jgi:hypothetical protein